jgi:hypothetical protein
MEYLVKSDFVLFVDICLPAEIANSLDQYCYLPEVFK